MLKMIRFGGAALACLALLPGPVLAQAPITDVTGRIAATIKQDKKGVWTNGTKRPLADDLRRVVVYVDAAEAKAQATAPVVTTPPVVSTPPATTPVTAEWKQIGKEGETITLTVPTWVRYRGGAKAIARKMPAGAFTASNATFTDPASGVVKVVEAWTGAGDPPADAGTRVSAALAVAPTVIGINLGSPSYYTWEFAFADIIKNQGSPFAEKDGAALTNQMPLDADGRPRGVPSGSAVIVPIGEGPYQLAGTYDCQVSPGWSVTGQLSLQNKVSQSGTAFSFTFPSKPADWPNYKLRVAATTEGASLGTFACARRDLPAGTTFNPQWLADMRPFPIWRFMDWESTNNSPPGTWATRTSTNAFTQATFKGVALEYQVQAANEGGADPWLCIPFDADADYVRRFATYVRDNMAPGHKAYIEFSNEVWNTGFSAARQAIDLGGQRYTEWQKGDFHLGDQYYADRVREVMAIVSDVFAGQMNRVVRVIGGQHGWPLRNQVLLAHKDTWKSVDALTTAPYFYGDVNSLTGTKEERLATLFAQGNAAVDATIDTAAELKAVAASYGLGYVAYEGGQHYFAYGEPAQVVAAAQEDPRMYDLYTRFLKGWQARVGGGLVLYSGTGAGSFPMLNYTGEPLDQAPKMRAVRDFMATLPAVAK